MDSLLNFTKHRTPKKTILEWSREDAKQKDDKFWFDYYMNTKPKVDIKPLHLGLGHNILPR